MESSLKSVVTFKMDALRVFVSVGGVEYIILYRKPLIEESAENVMLLSVTGL